MYYLKISGTVVDPAPQTMSVGIQDIDAKATRDAHGLLHRDRVATKRKITLTFGALTVSECAQILNAVKNEFFSVEFLDPQDGQMRSGTFYVGDRTTPVYSFVDTYPVWKGLSFDLIEQ
ncbi:DUF6711 family protein [Ligilactobacillus faecis]|uniref:DUF6711 family protein n=1 Tax=Ligilactobacillus faecis TaxID=762833 RepID=UPI00246986A2|nr:DUF6711 family protein [Ligilactobacillus faecis]WGN89766.1 hypothetical protein QFX10_01455 [Ligilactobacillus faecis]